MKKVNEYGLKLQDKFVKKAHIDEAIENGTFLGNIMYENYIESIEDAVGWMIDTYDYEALDILNEWIDNGSSHAWGLDIINLKIELQKALIEI